MTRIAMMGAAGRMGKAIIRCLLTEQVPGLTLVGAIDHADSPFIGEDAGTVAGASAAGVPIGADWDSISDHPDVVIDFSHPAALAGTAARLTEWGCGWVIGTTGLGAEQQQAIDAAAKKIPVVIAPNMSLGINLLLQLVEDAARALKDRGYDIEIVERHHRRKKDAPSGTALGLGEAAARGVEWALDDVACHGRSGMSEQERPDQQIGFHAIRGGDFVGDHTVIYAAEGESLELSHRATSRDTFAIGALQAAAWLKQRAAGRYSMRDVLGL